MATHKIDIKTIQETHSGEATREHRTRYSWYFAGGREAGTIHHGVAIVIRNELRNYMLDVEDINERLMIMTLRGKIPLHAISAYAPIAAAKYETETVFHDQLRADVKHRQKKGMTIRGADMNTKLRTEDQGAIAEEGIGQHILGINWKRTE